MNKIKKSLNAKIDDEKQNLSDTFLKMTDDEKIPTDEYKNVKANLEEFSNNLETIANRVLKTYLTKILDAYDPVGLDKNVNFSYDNRVHLARVTKWVVRKEERSIDKLINVYSSLAGLDCSVALVFRRKKEGVETYFVIVNQKDDDDTPIGENYYNMFVSALKGNFPGTQLEEVSNVGSFKNDGEGVINEWFSEENSNAIAMITNIASESSEKFISQGIEKLLDGIVPQNENTEYTLVLLAEPVTDDELAEQRELYCNMYTDISPFVSWQENHNISDAVSLTKNAAVGASLGIPPISINTNFGSAKTNTVTVGEGLTLTKTNYNVKTISEKIEGNVKRFQQGAAMGLWKFASYVIADNYSIAQNVANMYRSLTEGEESYFESAAINIWNDNRKDHKSEIDTIQKYLRSFTHPMFIKKEVADDDSKKYENYPKIVPGYTMISGAELAMSLNMPNTAVAGLPVFECAEFGRNIVYREYDAANKSDVVELGCIHHMQIDDESVSVQLNKESLAKHTFITGSTGSGKSTTVYKLLAELQKSDCKFLVIEPAKGEYKYALGDKARVLGTNPKLTELLKINPFRFPENIMVYEHIDRLTEIFNVCWPMYAAMPAVLKEAIERAYSSTGWNLITSENKHGDLYPCFADVLEQLHIVIEQSDYSQEVKSNYTGSLVTRVRSLTNGIYSLIFTCDDLKDSEIFDENVIIDLSRLGSTETKAMIMGLLVMRMQEYRMSERQNSDTTADEKLRHITVLEEAHNLLKRTSTEQSSEGSNLLGKSVEMLANSIAEMRTYGDGFIIADQSPGLLDMSVIRNTNTKIIHSLPDLSDRELVGRAAGLTDSQIEEICKLQKGVAAVYQNNWIMPVLCHVKKVEKEDSLSKLCFNPAENYSSASTRKRDIITKALNKEIEKVDKIDLFKLDIAAGSKIALIDIKDGKRTVDSFSAKALIKELVTEEMTQTVEKHLSLSCNKEIADCVSGLRREFNGLCGNTVEDIRNLILTYILMDCERKMLLNAEQFSRAFEKEVM